MHNLHQLIEQYGPPDSLIDHWDSSSNRFAVWGFEEEFVITNNGRCMLNGNRIDERPMVAWQDALNSWKAYDGEMSAVGYVSYDMKNLLFPHIPFKNPNASLPLLWFGKPKRVEAYEIKENGQYPSPILHLEKEIPLPTEYETAICKIKTHLMNGDSYQINFTQPKQFKLKANPLDIYLSMRETIHPHYGVYLKIDKLNILSFSPERFFCTFGRQIESFPM